MNRDDQHGVLRAHPIPSSDPAFVAVVDVVSRSANSPADLVQRLRPLYPDVRLSRRDLSNEPRIYYVYRDGAFIAGSDAAWWTDLSVAYVEISTTSGRITKANGSWAELMGLPPEQLIDRHYSEFLLPEAQETANALFASVLAHKEVQSRLLMRRADGTRIFLEFRAARDGPVCRVHYRPLPASA